MKKETRTGTEQLTELLGKQELSAFMGPQKYNAVVSAARIVAVNLIKTDFEVKPSFFGYEGELEYSFDLKSPAPVAFDSESGNASGFFHWALTAKAAEKTVLSLVAAFWVTYDSLAGLDGEAVEAFVRRVGCFTSYPYFRSFVSQMSWASGTNLPILPILREQQQPPSVPVARPQQEGEKKRRARAK
jgi:hypothetical protein